MLLAATLAALLAAPAGTQPAPAPEYAVFGDTLPPPPLVLPLEAPLYRWAEGSRLGLVDTLGAWVLPAAFEEIQGVRLRPDTRPGAPWVVLENPRAGGFRGLTSLPLWVTWEGQSFLLTAEGEWTSLGALEPAGGFEEGRLMVRGGGKVGFVDAAGRATVPVQLEAAGPFRGGHAFARVGGRWGLLDPDGTWVVAPSWDDVGQGGTGHSPWVCVRIGSRWGVVDRSGTTLVPVSFPVPAGGYCPWAAPPAFPVTEASGLTFYDGTGAAVFELACPRQPPCELSATPWSHGLMVVRLAEGDDLQRYRPGVIDTLGAWVLRPDREGDVEIVNDTLLAVRWGPTDRIFDQAGRDFVTIRGEVVARSTPGRQITSFLDGRFRFLEGEGTGALWGTMTERGVVLVEPRFEFLGEFAGGLAPALAAGDPLKGFIDETGAWVIPPAWDQALPFDGPLALVARHSPDCRDLEMAYIDRRGEVVRRTVMEKTAIWISPRCVIRR